MSEENKIGWHFSPNTNRMHIKLPYEEALDSDDAKIKSTLGREKIQNSLDACDDNSLPVKISFSWITLENDNFFASYINQLVPKLKSMEKVYDKNIVDLKNPSFLVVQDFNTTGLTGKFDPNANEQNDPNNYYGYFYKLGYSGKAKQDSITGGKKGIGRAVGAIASSINTMFIISKRNDDNKTFLKGLCLGKKFVANNTSYDGYGYFDKFKGERSISEPILEESYIKPISEKLEIDRYKYNGTSSIIPYPDKNLDHHSVTLEILRNYYVVISQGKLEIEILYKDGSTKEEYFFNKSNILEKLEEHNLSEEYNFLKNFLNPCFYKLNYPNFELQSEAASDGRISKTDFTDEEISIIRDAYNKKEIINLKANIQLKPKEKDGELTNTSYSEETFVNFFIQKKDSDVNSKAYFQRGLMPLMGEGKDFYANAYGFMYAHHKPAVSFIAASEGTNHLKINTSEPDLRENYRPPYNIQALFIKRGLNQLMDLMLLIDEEEDNNFEKDYFSIVDEKGINQEMETTNDDDEDTEEDPDEKQKPIFPPVKPPPPGDGKPLKITRLTSKKGYKIKANKKYKNINSMFPCSIQFKCAYSEYRKKKSFNNHEDLDFDLKNENKIKVDLKNARIVDRYSNKINFELENIDCEIILSDFYEKFEVDVEIEMV